MDSTTTGFRREWELFRMLGRGSDPTMLRLVCLLVEVGGISMTDFADLLEVPLQNTVQYFRALKDLRLGEMEKTGVANGRIFYLRGEMVPTVREMVRRVVQSKEARADVAEFRRRQAAGELLADPDRKAILKTLT